MHTEFINLDYFWRPGVDVCWDVTRGLPFADASMRGIFSEHCLEHFPLPEVIKLLRETRRLLMRGGGIRLVVPDGEQYLITYASHRCSETPRRFPYEDKERLHELWTPMLSVNRVFYQDRESAAGHCTMFDFELLAKLLRHCGFTQIERQQFGTGRDPRLLIDSPGRSVESLYVEARID